MYDNIDDKHTHDIQSYEFVSFSEILSNSDSVEKYKFGDLGQDRLIRQPKHQSVIKKERINAKNNMFIINPIVEKHRGLKDQEAEELENHIREEVERRVEELKDIAYNEGYESGVVKGQEDIIEQLKAESQEKILELTEMINSVLELRDEIVVEQKHQFYVILKDLVKWLTLKEVDKDDEYTSRLLEKLLLELNSKANLLIHVNQLQFERMPEVLEVVQAKLGELRNVRVEIDYQMDTPGLMIESENGIIDGSLEQQFKTIDKLFESVGVFESGE